jgi:hypothetical protein
VVRPSRIACDNDAGTGGSERWIALRTRSGRVASTTEPS